MENDTLKNGVIVRRNTQDFIVQELQAHRKDTLQYRCHARSHCKHLVTGDTVTWRVKENKTGVIESCNQRTNLLQRPDNFGRIKSIAANIEQMIIMVASSPKPQAILIDQYLVAANQLGVTPILLLNKTDLLTRENTASINALLNIYIQLGYAVLRTTCTSSTPSKELLGLMHNKTNIIVGQSGVGKSSLINNILPHIHAKIGALSAQKNVGKHTTVQAELFALPSGGTLIDSPGIRNFGLWNIDLESLEQGFIDIAKSKAHCRFRNCQHQNEPLCAVHKAVQEGHIHPQRLQHFNTLRDTILAQKNKHA